jgi:dTDP-4-amino-4,6-dideoxy-D-galactose acyltransferase
MKVKRLEWDSDFFNKTIGEVTLDKNSKPILVNDFDLIYLKSFSDTSYEIQNFKQTFIETKVIFEKKLFKNSEITNNDIFSLTEISFDINTLYTLAFESGKYSRFKLDKNFAEDNFIKLYKKWVDNSINNTFADKILVYVAQGEIIGFVTYKKQENHANIGLIAINPNHQARGIGKKLILAVENELHEIGIKLLQIPTQLVNELACKFYSSLGYKIIEKQIIKHYWRI